MKYISLILLAITFSVSFTSCEDEDKTFFQSEGAPFAGGYLLTIEDPGNEFVLSDLENSSFSVTFEAHDYTSDSSKLESVDVLVSINGNGEIIEGEEMLTSIPASSFTVNDNGYPEYTFSSEAMDAFTALSINASSVTSSDNMQYRMILNLTDGTSFSVYDINPDTSTEVNFTSPFYYEAEFVD